MKLFKKLFNFKKIKYVVKTYDGHQWIEVADGEVKNIEELENDINTMIATGVLNKKQTYKVEDSKGNVLLMNTPVSKTKEDDDTVIYKIEYREGKGARWNVYDESEEEYDIDIVDDIVDSGRLPAGAEVRIVEQVGRRKNVIYKKTVEGRPAGNGLVAETGSNIVINVEGIRQIKQSIEALREVRDTLDEVLGDKRQSNISISPNDYEGKPPWFMRPDIIQPFMQMALGMAGNNFVNGGNNGNINKGNVDDKLKDYLD